MSDSSPPIESEDDASDDEGADLQFDHAELTTPAAGGPNCDACKRPISDVYYEINGKVLCTSCRQQIEVSFRGGSSVTRVLKATLFGLAGALAGAVLYYAILRATGYHLGLVAVLVGFMVGGAVRKGTGGRGGRFYQFLALFLTYTSIVAFHVPLLIEPFLNEAARQGRPAVEQQQAPQPDQPKVRVEPEAKRAGENERKPTEKAAVPNPAAAAKDKVAKVDHAGAEQAEQAADAPRSLPVLILSFMGFLVLVVGFLYTVPVLVAKGDPISGLIFCFALWEAWKITRGVTLAFNGPFLVNLAKPGTATEEVVGDVE